MDNYFEFEKEKDGRQSLNLNSKLAAIFINFHSSFVSMLSFLSSNQSFLFEIKIFLL